jgi:hypothetical protein
MKLGFAEAVTRATNCGVPDLYRVWLFGSLSYKHTPQCAAFENREKKIDDNDFYRMSYLTQLPRIK